VWLNSRYSSCTTVVFPTTYSRYARQRSASSLFHPSSLIILASIAPNYRNYRHPFGRELRPQSTNSSRDVNKSRNAQVTRPNMFYYCLHKVHLGKPVSSQPHAALCEKTNTTYRTCRAETTHPPRARLMMDGQGRLSERAWPQGPSSHTRLPKMRE